jgi:predicted pyridoxine 5'-phosphate oxidase superfamily flavin-nucleotide-binding protein
MGKEYTEIDERIQQWIERQQVFFVATAPSTTDGLVNLSPKGLDSLRVTGPRELAYVDTGGSGIETVAHLRDNGRITLMMCAFEGPPKIFRFYGKGTPLEPHDEGFDALLAEFPAMPAARNIIRIHVNRIIDSCGYGVPLYDFRAHRDSLNNYFSKQSDDAIWAYRRENNTESLDGLPGLRFADDE